MSTAFAEFVTAGRTAFARSTGADALAQLGFAEVLDDLGATTSAQMAMATFEAQGAELADSAALGRLLGQPFTAHAGAAVVAAVDLPGAERAAVLVGPPSDALVAVDGSAGEVRLFASARVQRRAITVPGRLTLQRIEVGGASPQSVIDAAEAAELRRRSHQLGRLAIAFEIAGAARTAVALAVEHAKHRRQFDRPIATFQAVQHILAWAITDVEAIEAVAALALSVGDDSVDVGGTDLFGAAKALAGRNGLRACEGAMQVLGGIGFTAEHDHHHFHSRVLILDALLGSRIELVRGIGRAWRTEATDRRIPAAVLAAR